MSAGKGKQNRRDTPKKRQRCLFMAVSEEIQQMASNVLKSFGHLRRDASRCDIETELRLRFNTPASATHCANIIGGFLADKKRVVVEGAEVKCGFDVYLALDETFVALAARIKNTKARKCIEVARSVKQRAKQYLDAFKPEVGCTVVATMTKADEAPYNIPAAELTESIAATHHLQFEFLREVESRCQTNMPGGVAAQCDKVCEVTIKPVEDGLEISGQGFSGVDLNDAKRKDIYALALLGTDSIEFEDFAQARNPDLKNSKSSHNAAEIFNKMVGRLKQFVPVIKVVRLRGKKRQLMGIKIVKGAGVTDDMLRRELEA